MYILLLQLWIYQIINPRKQLKYKWFLFIAAITKRNLRYISITYMLTMNYGLQLILALESRSCLTYIHYHVIFQYIYLEFSSDFYLQYIF